MIDIAKGNYISRVWFFKPPPGARMDVLAHLWRRLPDGPWRFDYRFRYYEDAVAHDSKDRKSGYQGTFQKQLSEEAVVAQVEPVLEAIVESVLLPGFELDVLLIQTDEPHAVIHLLAKKPWAHLRVEEMPS